MGRKPSEASKAWEALRGPLPKGKLRTSIAPDIIAEILFWGDGTITYEAIEKLIQNLEIMKDTYPKGGTQG